jgi:hypothetical protein
VRSVRKWRVGGRWFCRVWIILCLRGEVPLVHSLQDCSRSNMLLVQNVGSCALYPMRRNLIVKVPVLAFHYFIVAEVGRKVLWCFM